MRLADELAAKVVQLPAGKGPAWDGAAMVQTMSTIRERSLSQSTARHGEAFPRGHGTQRRLGNDSPDSNAPGVKLKGACPLGQGSGNCGGALDPAMKKATINQAVALVLLLSGGGFIPAQAYCPHTDTYDNGSSAGRPDPVPDPCNAVRTPTPAPALATAQGSPRPPAPPALPEAQATQQFEGPGTGPKTAQGVPGKDGALGQSATTPNLAMALGSLPMPRVPGWAVSTSVTSVGSVALGLAHLVEDESLSLSFGVGTDWSHAQGIAVLSLNL